MAGESDVTPAWPPEPSMWARVRAAQERIARREAGGPGVRNAHLHEEEARIVHERIGGSERLTVEPGPVGSLVALAEVDRRGEPTELRVLDADALQGFPAGAIVLTWRRGRPRRPAPELLAELLTAARYALR